MGRRLTTILFSVLLLWAACKHKTESTLRISGGAVTYNYPFVLPLLESTTGRAYCSAVFIDKQVAVSAAHCFVNTGTEQISAPPVVVNSKGVFLASKVYVPKKYNKYSGFGYDFAIIVFNEDVVDSALKLKTTGFLQPGTDDLKMIGFGCNDTAARLMSKDSVLERAYTKNMIRWMSPEPMKITKLEFGANLDANAYQVEGTLKLENDSILVSGCPGDSGGALIYDNQLVGVTSRVSGSGRYSMFTSVGHKYASTVIQKILSGSVEDSDGLKLSVNATDFILAKELVDRLKAEFVANEQFLKANKQTIEKELQVAYREFLKREKVIAENNKAYVQIKSETDKLLPVLVQQLNALVGKHAELNPRIFPSLTTAIPPAKERHYPYPNRLTDAQSHLLSLYSCVKGDNIEIGGCRGLQLPYLLNFSIEFENETGLQVWEELDDQMHGNDQPIFVGVPVRADEGEIERGPPILASAVIGTNETLIAAVSSVVGKKSFQGAVIVPLYTFANYPENPAFIVPIKIEAKVVHGGKLIESVVLYKR
jgi:hypothetical protein